MGKRQCQNN